MSVISRQRLRGSARLVAINLLVFGVMVLALELVAAVVLQLQQRRVQGDPLTWNLQLDPAVGHGHRPSDYRQNSNTRGWLSPTRHASLKRYDGAAGAAAGAAGSAVGVAGAGGGAAARLPSKAAGGPRQLLVLGGSTTDPLGSQFSGREGTWPDHLGRLLAAPGRPVTIANAGVAGATSAQELARFLAVSRLVSPDLVLSLNGINETYFYDRKVFRDPDDAQSSEVLLNALKSLDRGGYLVVGERRLYACGRICFGRSSIGDLFDLLWQRQREAAERQQVRAPVDWRDLSRPRTIRPQLRRRIEAAADLWESNVAMMAALAAQRGVPYRVLLQPSLGIGQDRPALVAELRRLGPASAAGSQVREVLGHGAYLERINALYGELRQRCRRIAGCRDISLPPLSLTPELQYSDPRHPNSRGNAEIARRIVQRLGS